VYLETKLSVDLMKRCKSAGNYLDVTMDVDNLDESTDSGMFISLFLADKRLRNNV